MLGDRKDPALFNGVGAGKPNPRSGTKVVSERGRTIVRRRQSNFLGPATGGEEEEKAGSGRVSSRGH